MRNIFGFFLVTLLLLSLVTSCSDSNELDLNVKEVIYANKDAIISKIVPDNNYGDIEDLNVYAWTQSGELNVNRFLIDFDFHMIPDGAIIDSAFVFLYFNKTSGYASSHSGENKFYIERIISSWDEDLLTWNNQPTTSAANSFSYNQVTIGKDDLPRLQLTSLVQDIVNDKGGSYGLMFKLQSETASKMLLLSSSENVSTSLHPKLEVYYTSK